jgi:RES domain-containing protein
LIDDGVAGIKVPSSRFPSGVNLVLWKWADVKTRALTVLDPIGELPTT